MNFFKKIVSKCDFVQISQILLMDLKDKNKFFSSYLYFCIIKRSREFCFVSIRYSYKKTWVYYWKYERLSTEKIIPNFFFVKILIHWTNCTNSPLLPDCKVLRLFWTPSLSPFIKLYRTSGVVLWRLEVPLLLDGHQLLGRLRSPGTFSRGKFTFFTRKILISTPTFWDHLLRLESENVKILELEVFDRSVITGNWKIDKDRVN